MTEQTREIGYEVGVKSRGGTLVFCVPEDRKIRGFYADGYRPYMSDYLSYVCQFFASAVFVLVDFGLFVLVP